MSASALIGLVVLVGAWVTVRHLMHGATQRRLPSMVRWLREHRGGHLLLLALAVAGCGSYPFWVDGEPALVDWLIGVAGVCAFGYVFVLVLTRSDRYEQWARSRH